MSSVFGLAGLTGVFSEFSGATEQFQHALEMFFIGYGVVVLGLAALPSVRHAGLSVIVANVLYTAWAIWVLAQGLSLTANGTLFASASAVYTTIIGGLQYLAWRRTLH